ncbi:MAG TPA: helical backbone metal receptor [bacterium]|nr:helical backbone metal receptor [bacterium]HOL34309.1 helical backbone metal receptor [bacterium]HPP08615.1 helical backbone metal receptor [bacterium]
MKKISCFTIVLMLILFSSQQLSGANEKYPARVVSLGPYVTENLILLGVNKEIVGVTIHEKEEIKKDREIIGTLLDPNLETILKLKPDIVIASKEGNRKQSVEKIQKLGIRVEVLDEVITYNDLKKNFFTLARIFGKENIARDIVSDIEKQLKQYNSQKQKSKKKIFWQLGTKPLVTAGRDTYYNELSIYAGAKNIFEDMKTKYITINIEEVVKRNPDIIIAMGMGENEYVINFWDKFKDIEAVKRNKIFRVDDYMFCSPTPASFLQSIKLITNFLNN